MSLSGKAGRLAGRAEAIAVSEQGLSLHYLALKCGEARDLQRIETAGELRLRFAERIARAEQRSFKANKEALKVSKASATAEQNEHRLLLMKQKQHKAPELRCEN